MFTPSRRALLAGMTAMLAGSPAIADADGDLAAAESAIVAIEARLGGRIGVAAYDSGGNRYVLHRADEKFPMCSTFKLLAAAAVLKRVDAGAEKLDRVIPYGPADLGGYAPVTKAHVADGGMALGDLCAAAIDWSDNTAGNLLLRVLGGPAAVTQYARSLGDNVTRLDRDEPSLNTAIPGDERDTTTPLAMLRDMRAILLGDALSEASRRQLQTWLIGDRVGDKRLRAGLPPSWRVGDKTGSGDNGAANDIAILWPPDRAPILAAVYCVGSTASMDDRNAAHAEIGRVIARTF
jgi:beta-lactamase class A